MGGVLITKSKRLKTSDVLASYHPDKDGLTYYYWDDWALSGLLRPSGRTLTLGLAGGAGPRRLAMLDGAHRQVGVDLDVSKLPSRDWKLETVQADAFKYLAETSDHFDTIWVDLYDPNGLLPDVLSAQLLRDLRRRVAPNGLAFIHLFRPENRFYRYDRAADPFEPLFAGTAAAAGFQTSVFDHYASQTWVLSDTPIDKIRTHLSSCVSGASGAVRHWLECYMLRILRAPATAFASTSDQALGAAFRAAVAEAALSSCGLSPATGVQDFDAWTQTPSEIPTGGESLSFYDRLRWETLALWLTAPGLRLDERLRKLLAVTVKRHGGLWSPEVELRRAFIA